MKTNKEGVEYDEQVFTEQEVDDLLEHVRIRAVCPIDLQRQGTALLRKAARIQKEYKPEPYELHPNHIGYKGGQ